MSPSRLADCNPVSACPSGFPNLIETENLTNQYGNLVDVDAPRNVVPGASQFGLALDFGIMIGFTFLVIAVGTYSFGKMKVQG